MPEQAAQAGPRPVVDFLKIPENGDPYLEGHKCKSCGAIFLGERKNCSKCSARDKMETVKLSNKEVTGLVDAGKKGHLYVLTDTADKTRSQAVYVQEDAKIFTMGQDAKKEWTVKIAEI